MSRSPGARFLALLVLLALLPPPGHGNEGSVIGSCYCHRRIPSHSPPKGEVMAHFRKHLRAYDRCNSYIRFQLHSRSVCGGSKDAWVQELVSWFDRKEFGHADSGSAAPQELLPPPSAQVSEPTRTAPLDTGSPALTHLPPASQSTAQPTLPAGAPLDRNVTHADDITTSTEGHGRGAEEKQKQLVERVAPSARTSAMVPVVSLLTIIFVLTVVLLYVLCRRRREQSLRHTPDLPLYYTPVASDSNA